MSDAFAIRLATVADAPVLARHRAEMFRDMGDLAEELYAPLRDAARRDLAEWLAGGQYIGGGASAAERPHEIVAGAGLQLRPLLPRPEPGRRRLRQGPEAIVLNVFTERAWRRRGLARGLMERAIAWASEHGVGRLGVPAPPRGPGLYGAGGFGGADRVRDCG